MSSAEYECKIMNNEAENDFSPVVCPAQSREKRGAQTHQSDVAMDIRKFIVTRGTRFRFCSYIYLCGSILGYRDKDEDMTLLRLESVQFRCYVL